MLAQLKLASMGLLLLVAGACSPGAGPQSPHAADYPEFVKWLEHAAATAADSRTRLTAERVASAAQDLYSLDQERLQELLAEDFIQHNPMLEGGRDGLLSISGADTAPRGGGVNLMAGTAHVLIDGDHAVIHRTGKLGPLATINFDVLRFDDLGQLAEQWNFVQPIAAGLAENLLFSLVAPRPLDLIPAQRPSGGALSGDRSGFATPYAATVQQSEANKALVLRYLSQLGSGAEPSELAAHLDPEFVLHAPGMAPGRQAWLEVLGRSRRRGAAPAVVMALAQNDLVWVLGRLAQIPEEDIPELAAADLFRVRDQQIVEQWRLVQPSPRFSRNSNGLF